MTSLKSKDAAYCADDHEIEEYEEAGKPDSGYNEGELDAGHVLGIELCLNDNRISLRVGICIVNKLRDSLRRRSEPGRGIVFEGLGCSHRGF